MRRALLILITTLIVISCGPSRYAVHLEMRYPSRSGIELAGKIISVAYESNGEIETDIFNENMSDAFAKALEKDYHIPEGSIRLYGVDERAGDYSQRDSLISLVVRTDADVIFLFDVPEIGEKTAGTRQLKVNLYCYDGMNKKDKVFSYSGTTVLTASNEEELISQASDAGRTIAGNFFSQWRHEQYSIAYYDSQKWYEALARAEQYDWKGAMDIWFTMLDTHDLMKRASAEYNIAVACYMMGDLNLAEEWLKKSIQDNDMPTLTDALYKRIEARKQ